MALSLFNHPLPEEEGTRRTTRRHTAFTREGLQYLVIFLLVFFGALINDVNLLLILGGMLACPLLLSHHLAKHTLRGLVVQRRLPRAICAGDLLVVHVAIANTRRRMSGWVVTLEDSVRRLGNGRGKRNDPVLRPNVVFPYVPARQTVNGDYRGRLTQRGRYRLGPMQVSTRFPFGLFRYWFRCGQSATLTVLPRPGRLTQGWRAMLHDSFAGTERREHRPGIDGDFYGLRPWQRGDSRRWIHWRTTARTGEVMVRQFEQPQSRDAAIVLDLWQPAAADAARLENVELAVSFAATLAAELCRTGSSDVFLVAADLEPRMSGGPGSAALLQDMLERLALIEAEHRDRLPELLQLAAARIEPGTEIVLVSTRPLDLTNPDCAGRVPGEVMRRLGGRGMRVVDTSSEELARYFQPQ